MAAVTGGMAVLLDVLGYRQGDSRILAPERAGPNFDRYQVNQRHLHLEFDSNGRVARPSALLEPN